MARLTSTSATRRQKAQNLTLLKRLEKLAGLYDFAYMRLLNRSLINHFS